jgi:hypothetical protein
MAAYDPEYLFGRFFNMLITHDYVSLHYCNASMINEVDDYRINPVSNS